MIRVVDEWRTLEKLKNGHSIGRFGDADFLLMMDDAPIYYQQFDHRLKTRLYEVLRSRDPRFLVAVANIFDGLAHLNPDWVNVPMWGGLKKRVEPILDPTQEYFSAFITRPDAVTGLMDDSFFDSFKALWQDRDIVFMGNSMRVEQPGWKIHFRTAEDIAGHELFRNASGVTYLPAPREHAFAEYDQLLARCLACGSDKLFLLSLGPTATVLAHDLAVHECHAVDIGQLIMIYDMFREDIQPKHMPREKWLAQKRRRAERSGVKKLPELQPLHVINQVVGPEIAGDLVFDIGANAGMMTRIFREAGARVVAVEPQPELTRDNAAFASPVTVKNLCVGDREGSVPFYGSSLNTLSSCNPEWRNGLFKDQAIWSDPVPMPCTTLDALIAEFGTPKYIKIDVEGYEDHVLAGLTQSVELISFEYTEGYADLFEACLKEIERLGFSELLAFEVKKSRGEKFNQIVQLDHLEACRRYYRTLAKYQQGDFLVVHRKA